MKEKKMHKGLVSGDDFELISRNEDRNDHVIETVDRVLSVIMIPTTKILFILLYND